LKRYAELEPSQPNPEDSLGEISRYASDDQGSSYTTQPLSSSIQNTLTRRSSRRYLRRHGDFPRSRGYAKASALATNNGDRLHIEFQQALLVFGKANRPTACARPTELERKAHAAHEPYAEFEILEAHALLLATPQNRSRSFAKLNTHSPRRLTA